MSGVFCLGGFCPRTEINKLKNCFVGIFHFTFGQLAYCQNGQKRQILKNQIEKTIWSQFKVLMVIFFTKCISLLANG